MASPVNFLLNVQRIINTQSFSNSSKIKTKNLEVFFFSIIKTINVGFRSFKDIENIKKKMIPNNTISISA